MPAQLVVHGGTTYAVQTAGTALPPRPGGGAWSDVTVSGSPLGTIDFATAIAIVNAAHALNNAISGIAIVGPPDSAEEHSFLAAEATIYA